MTERLYLSGVATEEILHDVVSRLARFPGLTVAAVAPVRDAVSGAYKGFAYVDVLPAGSPPVAPPTAAPRAIVTTGPIVPTSAARFAPMRRRPSDMKMFGRTVEKMAIANARP